MATCLNPPSRRPSPYAGKVCGRLVWVCGDWVCGKTPRPYTKKTPLRASLSLVFSRNRIIRPNAGIRVHRPALKEPMPTPICGQILSVHAPVFSSFFCSSGTSLRSPLFRAPRPPPNCPVQSSCPAKLLHKTSCTSRKFRLAPRLMGCWGPGLWLYG